MLPVGILLSGGATYLIRYYGGANMLSIAATGLIAIFMLLSAGLFAARSRIRGLFWAGAIASWPYGLAWNAFVAGDVFEAHGHSTFRTAISLVIYQAVAAAVGGAGGALAGVLLRRHTGTDQKLGA